MRVIGLAERRGNYQGNDYHNIMLHCTKTDPNAIGELTEIVKLRNAKLSDIFGKPTSLTDLVGLIGKSVFVAYDRYQNVQSIFINDDSSE